MKPAILILLFGVIVAGFIIFSSQGSNISTEDSQDTAQINNVSIVDGMQIIEIRAKGGYTPGLTTAKAGIPTVIRMKTSGSFDCSSSVRIPSLGVSKLLPQSGTVDIDAGIPKEGPLLGACGMGMYRFEIDFKS